MQHCPACGVDVLDHRGLSCIQALRTQVRGIEVGLRLPEPLVDVLVFGAFAPGEDREWHMGCLRPDGTWQLTDSEPMQLHDVTHWMPLPPDPGPSEQGYAVAA